MLKDALEGLPHLVAKKEKVLKVLSAQSLDLQNVNLHIFIMIFISLSMEIKISKTIQSQEPV